MPSKDPPIININGTDYYVPNDRIDDLYVINGYLINTSSSSITLYASLRENGDYYSGYPRITCPTFTKAYIQQSYNSSSSTLSISTFQVENKHIQTEVLLLILLLGMMMLSFFKRR